MADEAADALVEKYGNPFANRDASDTSANLPEDDAADALIQKYGNPFQKSANGQASKSAQATPTDEYEQRIQKFMPEAQKRAAALGTFGGVESGISRIPIVGDVVSEIGADITAALPSSISEAEGQTYGERRQNIKALKR